MFRRVLGGVSVVALELASLGPASVAYAQLADKPLPAVTVEAPAPAKRAVRAPAPRPAPSRRQARRPAAPPAPKPQAFAAVDTARSGAHSGRVTPPGAA